VNTGTIVSIALGTVGIYTSNTLNPFTITGDRSFFILGDNNGYTGYLYYTGGTNSNAKMARVWKVQEVSGDVGSVVIDTTDNNATYLLVSSNPNFTGSVTEYTIS